MAAVIDLTALPETGLVVPGIASWLGFPPAAEDEPVETYEALCARLSREPIR
ncbi:hypothetical protein AB0C91_10440 [Streptomyces sp. NPDC048674]|uniref:hypothetical protein n=1 Tax=Streptomyces sp. NPDC048674 TaxID=3155491 RepID=UPI003424FA7A